MAETGQRDDPFPQYNFRVEIDGVARAGFTECSGLEASLNTASQSHHHRSTSA